MLHGIACVAGHGRLLFCCCRCSMALATSCCVGLQVLHGGRQFALRNAGHRVLVHTQLGNPTKFTSSWKAVLWSVPTTLALP